MLRSFAIAAALLAATSGTVLAQSEQDTLASPVLRANVTVSSDVVRIGDVVDNAGTAAQVAIFRAPDLGTTGSLPIAQLLAALRAHQVIGIDTRDLREVTVTRSSRTLVSKEIEQQVARVLERRNGLGDAANISVTFERDLRELQLDAAHTGDMRATIVRFDP
ncbi:MAG: flagellar basal body P-ring formation chaperone FlgA, partial [Afipia sp.]